MIAEAPRAFWGRLPVVVLMANPGRTIAVALNLNEAADLPGHPAYELARQLLPGDDTWICHWVAATDVREDPFELEVTNG